MRALSMNFNVGRKANLPSCVLTVIGDRNGRTKCRALDLNLRMDGKWYLLGFSMLQEKVPCSLRLPFFGSERSCRVGHHEKGSSVRQFHGGNRRSEVSVPGRLGWSKFGNPG